MWVDLIVFELHSEKKRTRKQVLKISRVLINNVVSNNGIGTPNSCALQVMYEFAIIICQFPISIELEKASS